MKIIASLAHVYYIASTYVWFQNRQSFLFSVPISIRITYRSFILERLILTHSLPQSTLVDLIIHA